MSEVPLLEAKTALKKMSSEIVDISGLNSEFIPKLRTQPEYILEAIEKYENEKNNLMKTISLNNEKINNYKNKISQNQRDLQRFEEDNNFLDSQRQELLNKIQETQQELEETRKAIQTKKEELNSRTTIFKELEIQIFDITRVIEKFEEELKALEKELDNTFIKKEKYVQSYENRVKAMKILINKKYINSSIYQFFRALQVGSSLDLRNILLAIDMRVDQAKKIIDKLIEEKAPIVYDQNSNTITLKEELDF
ncbi:MAG: coiled-coil domain-containing protein [Candidatus Thorarchaeota archaeon]